MIANKLNILFVLILLLILGNCSREPLSPDDQSSTTESFFDFKEETMLISDDSNEGLMRMTEDELIFDQMNKQLDSIHIGSVLVFRPSKLAPVG